MILGFERGVMFGERLQELRKDRGMIQKDLAKVLSLSWQTISSYETGQSMPGSDTLKSIARYFDISLNYLFELIDHPASYRRERNLELIRNYQEFDPEDQQMADTFIAFLQKRKR